MWNKLGLLKRNRGNIQVTIASIRLNSGQAIYKIDIVYVLKFILLHVLLDERKICVMIVVIIGK